MTDAVEAVTEAPAGHYYATMRGRRILIKDINPAQSMVLGGFLRQIKGDVDYDRISGIFGKLMQLVENLIVEQADIDWLESLILDGEIDVPDFAEIFHSHTAETPAVKKPRRGK